MNLTQDDGTLVSSIMDRLITYKSRTWIGEDEVLYSDCSLNPGVNLSIKPEPRMKLMFVLYMDTQEVEWYYEHYEPAEVHEMFERDPTMVLEAFTKSRGDLTVWKSLTHEQQVYNMMMCYDYYLNTFDMSDFDPSD